MGSAAPRPGESGDAPANPPPANRPGGHLSPYVLPAAASVVFVLLAIAVLARHGRPFGLDSDALHWAVDHRPHTVVRIATLFTDTGQGVPAYLLALAAGLTIGYAVGHTLRLKIVDAVAALVFLALVQLLRYGIVEAIGRHRPPLADRAVTATGLAFPSGHTTNSAVVAGLFVFAALLLGRRPLRTLIITIVITWAVAVALSRVYLGVHWLTDVIGGWLLATALVSAAWIVLTRMRSVPSASPRRAGTKAPNRF